MSKFKIYSVFSYRNLLGPQYLARYLNCVKLHRQNVSLNRETFRDIYECYFPLLVASLRTIETVEGSFVITDEEMTAIVTKDNIEILGDLNELPDDQRLGWFILKSTFNAGYRNGLGTEYAYNWIKI